MTDQKLFRYSLLYLLAIIFVVVFTHVSIEASDSNVDNENNETENIEIGYDEGFDFESLAVMGTTWRLGMTYFNESLLAAQLLNNSIDSLLADPRAETLAEAKRAWSIARTPYLRSEIYRYISPRVASWEGRVNTWPIDAKLIDYVSMGTAYNQRKMANANLISSKEILIDGDIIEVVSLNQKVLDSLSKEDQFTGYEKNSFVGYHAIEFMLWGDSTYGGQLSTDERPWTDFAINEKMCTGGYCERRRAYLKLISDRLVSDLEHMASLWKPGAEVTSFILSQDPHEFIEQLIRGAADFVQLEMAEKGANLALSSHDPYKVYNVFSRQTHLSHFYNFEGLYALFKGCYIPTPGIPLDVVKFNERSIDGGTQVLDLYVDANATKNAMENAMASVENIRESGEQGSYFDLLIEEGNPLGNKQVEFFVSQLLDFSSTLKSINN